MRLTIPTCVFTLLCSSTAVAAPGESSFTPVSMLVPIHAVRLESSATNQSASIYQCAADLGAGAGPMLAADAGSDADGGIDPIGDCLVDMADNAALATLFAHMADVQVGTYDRIRVYLCGPGPAQGYTSYVKGTPELSGAPYYTQSGAGVLSPNSAHLGYAAIDYSGCASDVPLPAPLTVADGDVVTVSAFFSLRNIAWATLTSNGPPGGCAFDTVNGRSVCAAYPIPITYVGSLSPALDIYYITEDTSDLTAQKAGGQMLILRDPLGTPFGGFSRRLYSPTSVQPSVNYDTPIKTLTTNALSSPQTYTIENYGGGSPGGVPLPFYLRFPAFELATHDGSMQRSDGSSFDYRAVKQ